jgi:hypothetical protein
MAEFCRKADAASVGLETLYLEMNGFAINPNQWHCNMFGYKKAGDIWDLDWLAEWDAEHPDRFVLIGMEPLQEAFAELFAHNQTLGIELAEEIAEHLVTARFMQLVAAAHLAAKHLYPALAGLPIFATAHDWDTVHRTC